MSRKSSVPVAEHGGDSILPIVFVGDRVRGTEALAGYCTNCIPDGRAAKLGKLAGEYQVDHERHTHQLPASEEVLLVGSVIGALFCKLSAIIRSGSAHAGSFTYSAVKR